uniref:Peptidase C1A papain C-terminal domain-containing protein n=1 Tax=viral metagenome TaxID=1070528 RepID=A0A6C0I4I1_9ZZZZ
MDPDVIEQIIEAATTDPSKSGAGERKLFKIIYTIPNPSRYFYEPLTESGETVLHLAIQHNNKKIVLFLLMLRDSFRIDENQTTSNGDSTLQLAVLANLPEMCRVLITERTSTLDLLYENKDGKTALDLANELRNDCVDVITAAQAVPTLLRLPSSIVENQLKTPLCWKHVAAKIGSRFMFILCDIDVTRDKKCIDYYERIEMGEDMATVFYEAIRDGRCRGNAFLKLVVTLFLHKIMGDNFNCTKGGNDIVILKFLIRDVIGSSNGINRYYQNHPDEELTAIFQTYAQPVFNTLYTNTYDFHVVKITPENLLSNSESIFSVLRCGFYIYLGVYLGQSFLFKFFTYRKPNLRRPIPRNLIPSAEYAVDPRLDHSGHAMTIVGYNNIYVDGVFTERRLVIKNSWGKDWGINGTIEYSLEDLIELFATFSYIEARPAAFPEVNPPKNKYETSDPNNVIVIDEREEATVFNECKDVIIANEVSLIELDVLYRKAARKGVNKDYVDTNGKTALIYGLENHVREEIWHYLASGATLYRGFNPLQIAIENNYSLYELKKLVNEHTINRQPYIIYSVLNRIENPRRRESESGRGGGGGGGGEDEIMYFCKYLIERGINVNVTEYETPLHICARNNRLDLVTLFIDSGASILAKDTLGNSPLFYAIRKNQPDITTLLLSRGAQLSEDEKQRLTETALRSLYVGGNQTKRKRRSKRCNSQRRI